jgi:hypothetical protein
MVDALEVPVVVHDAVMAGGWRVCNPEHALLGNTSACTDSGMEVACQFGGTWLVNQG